MGCYIEWHKHRSEKQKAVDPPHPPSAIIEEWARRPAEGRPPCATNHLRAPLSCSVLFRCFPKSVGASLYIYAPTAGLRRAVIGYGRMWLWAPKWALLCAALLRRAAGLRASCGCYRAVPRVLAAHRHASGVGAGEVAVGSQI